MKCVVKVLISGGRNLKFVEDSTVLLFENHEKYMNIVFIE